MVSASASPVRALHEEEEWREQGLPRLAVLPDGPVWQEEKCWVLLCAALSTVCLYLHQGVLVMLHSADVLIFQVALPIASLPSQVDRRTIPIIRVVSVPRRLPLPNTTVCEHRLPVACICAHKI